MRGKSILERFSVYFLVFSLLITTVFYGGSFDQKVEAASLPPVLR